MATPAFRRTGDKETGLGGGTEGHNAPARFAANTTAELIELRDRLLEECLDLERRAADAEDNEESDLTDAGTIRVRIDEIHHELAMRDLGERVGPAVSQSGNRAAPAQTPCAAETDIPSHAVQKALQILSAIESRSRFMDELAWAARDEGRLDQAAAFTLSAQQLDLERVDVLRKLTALGAETAGAEE